MTRKSFDFAIIGAGHAGAQAAAGIRQVDQDSSIALFGDERHLPYERPILSKQGLKNPRQLTTHYKHDRPYYDAKRIDLNLGVRVVRIDQEARQITCSNGQIVEFAKLIIATGSRPRRLSGAEPAKSIVYLRTLDDAQVLSQRLEPNSRVAIIGGGFIGLEVAATAQALGCRVSVLEYASSILARVLPACIARPVKEHHEKHGIDIRTNARITRLAPIPSGAIQVESDVDGGRKVEVFDLIVVGVGVKPNTELAQAAGLAVQDGLVVDEYGRTENPNIFGAGEVTNHPIFPSAKAARRESWQVAEFQAMAVGRTAAGQPTAFRETPWLWSDQGDLNIQILGHVAGDAEWVFRGDPDAGPAFCAFALAQDSVVGAVAMNAGRDVSGARRLIVSGCRIPKGQLADKSVPIAHLLGKYSN